MANFNKVILAGNLTRDPQLSYLPSNTPVCEFGMAINRKWKGQDGQMKEDTCFVDLRMFGRRAEVINQYVRKGNPRMVEGRLKFDTWEGKDGAKLSKLYVVVEDFQFIGGAGGGGGGARAASGAPQRAAAPAPAAAAGYAAPPVDVQEEMPPAEEAAPPEGDAIPF